MAVKSEGGLFLLLTNSILEFKDFVDITNYVISIMLGYYSYLRDQFRLEKFRLGE